VKNKTLLALMKVEWVDSRRIAVPTDDDIDGSRA
jgi:hypothetical protein